MDKDDIPEKDKEAEKDKADPLQTDQEADPLQQAIDPLRLATSRGHVPGPRRGAGRGGGRVPRLKTASQPMPPLELEVVGAERPRRACTQDDPRRKK